MRWIAPVAVLIAALLVLATLGVQASFTFGALAIFSAGMLLGRLVSRRHGWVAIAGICVVAAIGLIAVAGYGRGEDPWWQLIAVIVGVLTVTAAAMWCAGVWLGAKIRRTP
jgi:hypothetical protein